MDEVKLFFKNHEFYLFDWDPEKLVNNLHYTTGQAFQNSHYTPIFVAQTLEISRFVMAFYEQECSDLNDDTLEADIQRMLLMNVNINFFNVKLDFVEPLDLICQYLKLTKTNDFTILVEVGAQLIYKMLAKTSNID